MFCLLTVLTNFFSSHVTNACNFCKQRVLIVTCTHTRPHTQVAFAAADSVTGLKLIEAGLPSERIALMAVPLVPVQIVLPWVIRYSHL